MTIAFYLILLMCILTIAHFVYESIIAPTVRLGITVDLLMMKDELDALRKKERGRLDDEHYRHLRDAINGLSNRLYSLELTVVSRILARIHSDRDLRARMEATAKVLDDCPVQEARDMRRRIIKLAALAIQTNSKGWAFYIVPIAICIGCMRRIKRAIVALASLPEKDLKELAPAPPDMLAAA